MSTAAALREVLDRALDELRCGEAGDCERIAKAASALERELAELTREQVAAAEMNDPEALRAELRRRLSLLADADGAGSSGEAWPESLLMELLSEWQAWGAEPQRPPEGDWRCWSFLGGRGAGKTRAAPSRVKHAAIFSALEDELCGFGADDFRGSPDRLDALVWALTDLLAGGAASPQVRIL